MAVLKRCHGLTQPLLPYAVSSKVDRQLEETGLVADVVTYDTLINAGQACQRDPTVRTASSAPEAGSSTPGLPTTVGLR